MTPSVAVLLQARLASTRLPGKALERIGPRSLLAHCLRRLKQAGVGPVVLATTTLAQDDALVEEAESLGIPAYRGDVDDVLGRFAGAAGAMGVDYVIRATGDNPAVDPASCTRLLTAIHPARADYAVERGLPCGTTVEIMTASALADAHARARDAYDREHVTPFIRRNETEFRCLLLDTPLSHRRPELRFTVDTAADLAYMRAVASLAGGDSDLPALPMLIAAADALAARAVPA